MNFHLRLTLCLLNLEFLVLGIYIFFKYYDVEDCYNIFSICNLSILNYLFPVISLLLIWPQILLHSLASITLLAYSTKQVIELYQEEDKTCLHFYNKNYKSIWYYFIANMIFLSLTLIAYLYTYIKFLIEYFNRQVDMEELEERERLLLNENDNLNNNLNENINNNLNSNIYENDNLNDNINNNIYEDEIESDNDNTNSNIYPKINEKRRMCNL